MSYTVRAATDAAVRASISTPVCAVVSAHGLDLDAVRRRSSSSTRHASAAEDGRAGSSSLVRFAAMIPASWAVARASPFGSEPSLRRRLGRHAHRGAGDGATARQRLVSDVHHAHGSGRLVDVREAIALAHPLKGGAMSSASSSRLTTMLAPSRGRAARESSASRARVELAAHESRFLRRRTRAHRRHAPACTVTARERRRRLSRSVERALAQRDVDGQPGDAVPEDDDVGRTGRDAARVATIRETSSELVTDPLADADDRRRRRRSRPSPLYASRFGCRPEPCPRGRRVRLDLGDDRPALGSVAEAASRCPA